jgi:hypothetical protein
MRPEQASTTDKTVPDNPLPPGYEDYAGEIQVVNGKPPRWVTRVPYVGILLALAYYALVHVSDPVNLIFAALFIVWMIYTPIAQKRGWFFIPM